MTTVALVGGDGAGKTTVAEMLMADFPGRVKYLYMGASAASANVALPTTRIAYALKVRRERKRRKLRGEDPSGPVSLHGIEHRGDRRGRILATARMFNRMAEEIVRQVLSWTYQARGFLVVYDRHFLLDFSQAGPDDRRASERIHTWFLEHLYPKPHLTLFLDAPADVLVARKQEVPERYLQRKRAAILERGARLPHFEVVDASRSIDEVYGSTADVISEFVASRRARRWSRFRRVGLG